MYNAQTICLSFVEHHMACYVVLLGYTSLHRHGGPLVFRTMPYHQCVYKERSGLQFQMSPRSTKQGSLLH